jgi:hypothetical protein
MPDSEKTAMDWYREYEQWVHSLDQLTPLTKHTYTTHAKRFAKWIDDRGTSTSTKEAV